MRKDMRMERFEDFCDTFTEEFDEAPMGFKIKDASTADWAISKIADNRNRTKYFVDCAEQEIKKLKEQIKDAQEKCEREVQFLSGCLGQYLELEEVPKKKTKIQETVTLPAGKIVKKLPKIEFVMYNGEPVTSHKDNDGFIDQIRDIDRNLIKTKEEVDWANLKPLLSSDDSGNVIYTKTGELIDMLETKETLPYIEIKTE